MQKQEMMDYIQTMISHYPVLIKGYTLNELTNDWFDNFKSVSIETFKYYMSEYERNNEYLTIPKFKVYLDKHLPKKSYGDFIKEETSNRICSEENARKIRKKAREKDPRIGEITDEIRTMSLKCAKAMLTGKYDNEYLENAYLKKSNKLKIELEDRLRKIGYTKEMYYCE